MDSAKNIRGSALPDNSMLFFTIMGLASYYTFLNSHTLFVNYYLRWIGEAFKISSVFLSVLLLAVSFKLYDLKKLLLIFSFVILTLLVAWNSGWEFYGYMLWIYFVLIIGSKCIEFRKIIKFHLVLNLCFCLINIFADMFGLTDKSLEFLADERMDMFEGDVITRWSAGYPAAVDFATHLLYLLLDFWILFKGKMNLWRYIPFLIADYIALFLCDARQASVCILLLLIFSVLLSYLDKKGFIINKTVAFFIVMSIPFLFTVSLFATLLYDESNPLWLIINIALSGRLKLGLEGINEYGITWLGQNILLVGAGYAAGDLFYNYIDSTYIQFLLRWGVIVMTILILFFAKIGIDAFKRKDNTLLFSLLLAGMSSVVTQFLFDLNYCVLVLAITALHRTERVYQKSTITI